jgi:AcrR family transcriptional regulator
MATSHLAVQPEISVRENILAAGKHLFHVVVYDASNVEAICRQAQTTEAAFILYFGRKDALLEAIFEDGWFCLLSRLPKVQSVVSARERIKEILRVAVEFFNQDRVFSELLVFEGPRLHDGQMMLLTPSYTDFIALLDSLVQIETSELEAPLFRSALMGACEGLVRDLILRERFGYPAAFSPQQVEQFVSRLVDDLIHPA